MVKQYIAYLKKTVDWLGKLSRDEGLSLAWVYMDYARAVLFHRCLIRQYVIGEFWKKSSQERKRCLTYSRISRLFNRYNQPDYIHYLNEKPEFNAYFKDFVHREWMHIKKASETEFVGFLKRHKDVIIKPVDGVEGGDSQALLYRSGCFLLVGALSGTVAGRCHGGAVNSAASPHGVW